MERGIAICTYNRSRYLKELIDCVFETKPDQCRVVLCDDGSTDETSFIARDYKDLIYVRGPNLGVAANKNRALFTLQDCNFIAIIEDDLFPVKRGWFERYEHACLATGIHHYCRVQDKQVEETVPEFTEWMKSKKATPIYGESPRGDFTFISNKVLADVGGFNPQFIGAGYAHGEWSNRVAKAGLIPHPLKWVDIKEARDCFEQRGDTEGGRWLEDKREIKEQLKRNRAIQRNLKASKYIFHPLVMT